MFGVFNLKPSYSPKLGYSSAVTGFPIIPSYAFSFQCLSHLACPVPSPLVAKKLSRPFFGGTRHLRDPTRVRLAHLLIQLRFSWVGTGAGSVDSIQPVGYCVRPIWGTIRSTLYKSRQIGTRRVSYPRSIHLRDESGAVASAYGRHLGSWAAALRLFNGHCCC